VSQQAGLAASSKHCVLRLSVNSFVRCQTYEHDILKTSEPVLMQIGTVVHVARTLGSGGQRSRSHKAV